MAQAYDTSCVPSQPLDKISLQNYFLYSFPSYLQFIVPFVNPFQAMDFLEEQSIKIFDINYHSFLSFIEQCFYAFGRPEKPNCDMITSETIQHFVVTFKYSIDTKEYAFLIEEAQVKFTFNHRLFPVLITALGRILFKTFGYSHNINFTVNQYLQLAPVTLIQNPNYTSCHEIFSQLEANFIDFFLLYDIIERHKKVLNYLKLFQTVYLFQK
jgi:hypothetical protein